MTKKLIMLMTCILLAGLILMACGKQEDEGDNRGHYYYYPSTEETESTEEVADLSDLYLILKNDSLQETMHLYSYATGMQYQVHYAFSTNFVDRYGNHSSSVNFTPGRVIWIGDTDINNNLLSVGISDLVWEYKDITRFETAPEDGTLTIADSLYKYESDSFTFSGDDQVTYASITADDTLSVVGIGRKILSVCITTGHGSLELLNTELFEGSFLQLDTRIFVEITENLVMDLPEGSYQLSVANNGWGGTCPVEIVRGETTQVDLDLIKGDGPSYGSIVFEITGDEARLFIDDEEVDYSQAVEIQYGRHSLLVTSSDSADFRRILYVNSPEATIEITIEDEDDISNSQEESDSEAAAENTASDGDTNSTDESSQEESGQSTDKNDYEDLQDYLEDYLSTLSSMLGSDL